MRFAWVRAASRSRGPAATCWRVHRMIGDGADWPGGALVAETPMDLPFPAFKRSGRWPRARALGQEFRLWQGLAIAAGVHIDAVLVAIALSAMHLRPPLPPPEGPPISVSVVETVPPGNTQEPAPQNHAAPRPPAPVTQTHAAPAPPAPPARVQIPVKPAEPLAALAKGAPDLRAPAPPAPVPARPAVVAKPAPPPPPPPVRVEPAKLAPALVQGAKSPVVKTVITSQGITRPAKADQETTVFYSMYARESGQQGLVRLSVLVLPSGMPGAVTVVGSSGYPVLDNVARSSVMTWRFQPALKNGVPVASTLTYVFKFALQ